jgi:hypothetical protein
MTEASESESAVIRRFMGLFLILGFSTGAMLLALAPERREVEIGRYARVENESR